VTPMGAMMRVLTATLRGIVRLYQIFVSPMLLPRCRYLPSCSDYALEALAHHGALRGLWLTVRRLARCHPWGGSGYDPVPPPGLRPAKAAGCGAHLHHGS
jgi:uncharacterized protein